MVSMCQLLGKWWSRPLGNRASLPIPSPVWTQAITREAMIKKESEKVLVRAPGLMAQPTSGSGQTMSDTAKEFSSPEKALSMMAILKMTSGTEMESSPMPVRIESQALGSKIGSTALENSKIRAKVQFQWYFRTIWLSQAKSDKLSVELGFMPSLPEHFRLHAIPLSFLGSFSEVTLKESMNLMLLCCGFALLD
jgi:hypothetical protein